MAIRVNWMMLLACVAPLGVSACGSSYLPTDGHGGSSSGGTSNSPTTNTLVGDGISSDNSTLTATTNVVTAKITSNGNRDVASVELDVDGTIRTWGASSLRSPVLGGKVIRALNESGALPVKQEAVLVGDPKANDFNYQTYGAWYDTSTAPGSSGSFSVGRKIDSGEWTIQLASAPPSVTFTGTAAGYLYDGTDYKEVVANAELVANIPGGIGTFKTMNTSVGGSLDPSHDLNASSLSLSAGTFIGSIATAHVDPDDRFSGDVGGAFYGSGAQEAGGTFLLTGNPVGINDGKVYVGGFGVKK